MTTTAGYSLLLSPADPDAFLAARLRPGAGTLLTLIAIVAVLAQWVVKRPVGLSLWAQGSEARGGRMTVTLPRARVSPETNTVGGITFEDPYQWLEATTEETTRWQSAQDDAAREYIRAWPGWGKLRGALERSTNAGQ